VTPLLLAIGSPGLPELLVIAAILVLLFGVNKLPRYMKDLGRSIRELREGVKAATEDDDEGGAR